MILIVEGPDLSGKTYAIEKIAKHFNSGFVLKNSFKPKSKTDTPTIYAKYVKLLNLAKYYLSFNKDELIILDRFYPSQAVYSYLRGLDELDSPNINFIEDQCLKDNCKMIYVDTDIKLLEERYDKRGDEHISKAKLLELKKRYDEFMIQNLLPLLRINTLEKDWLKQVEEFIK